MTIPVVSGRLPLVPADNLFESLFAVFFPDDCRLCQCPLTGWTRVPVCADCLAKVFCGFSVPGCLRCGLPIEHAAAETTTCGGCLIRPPAFDRARALGPHEGALRSLIHLLKYDGMRPLAATLARGMADVAAGLGVADVIAPVPLHRSRRFRRGFNQAALLARELSRLMAVPVEEHCLDRRRATRPQTGLSPRARRLNVRGAFVVPDPGAVAGRRVLLVDDVMTTGATLDACARVLRRSGVVSVMALAAARAPFRLVEPVAARQGVPSVSIPQGADL